MEESITYVKYGCTKQIYLTLNHFALVYELLSEMVCNALLCIFSLNLYLFEFLVFLILSVLIDFAVINITRASRFLYLARSNY